MKRTAILFFLFTNLLPTVIYGQAVSARLEGRIEDPVKAVVGSAEIVATEQETGQVFKTASNEAGLYVFPNLAPGHYKLTVSASGFAQRDVDGIVLQIGDAKHADVLLAISGANSIVDVEADATSVNTTTTETGSVVSNQQAVELPLNGRDAMMLVYLQAGTNPIDAQSTVTANGGGGPGAQQQVGVVDGLPPGTSEIKVEGILASN